MNFKIAKKQQSNIENKFYYSNEPATNYIGYASE